MKSELERVVESGSVMAYIDTESEGRGALYWKDGRIRCRTATSNTDAGVECSAKDASAAVLGSWGLPCWRLTWADDEPKPADYRSPSDISDD